MYKVCLDAGHGGNDPGACGNGLKEADITLKVTLKVGKLLKQRNIEVIYTRTDDKPLWNDSKSGLAKRVYIANNAQANLFVSIHVNSGPIAATGIETLCYRVNGNGYKIASLIQKHLIADTRAVDRGCKQRPDLYVLRHTAMPSTLTEIGFISNPKDAQLLKDNYYLEIVSKAITKSILEYFGMKYEEPLYNVVLKEGDSGEAVKELQNLLNKYSYKLKPDGIFGKITLGAVKDFQRTHNLTADGIVGPKTWEELRR